MAANGDEDDLEEQLAQFEREIQQVSTSKPTDEKISSPVVPSPQPSASFSAPVPSDPGHRTVSTPISNQPATIGSSVPNSTVISSNPLSAPYVSASITPGASLDEPHLHYNTHQWHQGRKAWPWGSDNNAVPHDTRYLASSTAIPPHIYTGPMVAAPNYASSTMFMPGSVQMPMSAVSGSLLQPPLHVPVPVHMTSIGTTILPTSPALVTAATTGSVSHSEESAPVPSAEGEAHTDKAAKKKGIKRTAAGQVWQDPTLQDWPENDHRLFVGDLGPDATDVELAQAFSKYSSFNMARVVKDKRTSACRGYGFVSFSAAADMLAAIKEMDGKYVGSRPVKLRRSNWQKRSLTKDKWKQVHDFRAISKRHRR